MPTSTARIEEQREDAGQQTLRQRQPRDDLRGKFAGARVRRMRLDDDGAARGKSGGGVSTGDREGEREVAGAEDDDGAERAQHGANVGARQRLAVGQSRIDARVDPGALLDNAGEETKLV